MARRIRDNFQAWEKTCEERFNQLKANEEELNRIYIQIYGLQNELKPEIDDKYITVRKAHLQREIKSLISYAVGCMFGRYSLDADGLVYAGGAWESSKYRTFKPVEYNIIPIAEEDYFKNDILELFQEWLKIAYGEETLEENLTFIAQALTPHESSLQAIRLYFLRDFYQDHLKLTMKRPFYWLFDSGKNNAFKALIYIHRYQPDLLARMRTEFIHPQQERYRTQLDKLSYTIEHSAHYDRILCNKRHSKLLAQDTELRRFEEKIHHLADQRINLELDAGVKENYTLFESVLAKK